MALILGPPVPSLARWGGSPIADLLYRRLITLGPDTPAQLGRELGIPSRQVAAAVDELVAVGAVTATRRTVRAARKPAEVITALRQHRAKPPPAGIDDRGRHTITARLIAHATELGEVPRHRSRAQTTHRLAEIVAGERHEHLAMNPEQAHDAAYARPAVAMDRMLLDRGVRVRVLGSWPRSEPDPMVQFGRRPDEVVPDYREIDTVPMKLFIADRRHALFPAAPHDFNLGYLEVSQPAVVAALVALFEKHWTDARVPEPLRAAPVTLDARERALIDLLAQGYTDAAAAERLYLSRRSVTKMLRALMDRMGVDNRFQLGLALGTLGITRPPPS